MWACLEQGAWGDTLAGHECAIRSQASHGVNPVKGLLGPVQVLKAASVEYTVGVAFL
jgi:hypothetical protein